MLGFINKYVFGVAVPVMLVLAGIYFFFYLKAFHITKLGAVVRAMTGRQEKVGVSPFRAVTLALAGTLGVGNIVGVSAAIYLGGFGSIFWMWVSAFFAMLLKYAEIVLAMRHRAFDTDGKPHGSAMQYIEHCLCTLGLPRIGRGLAVIFALFCIINALSMGSMIQINAVSSSFEGIFHISPILTGGALAFICAIIISKGTDGISRLTETIVPFMTLGYIILSIAVICIKGDKLDDALASIFKSAFSGDAAFGGIGGFLLSRSLRYGVMRGLISNEAGCGTAPTAHATSNSKSAVEQGFWGIFEVFADTIVLCTMTALVVILSYPQIERFGENSIMMTLSAYSVVLGEKAAYFLAIAVLFFAFATVICWAHYGIESMRYISKREWLQSCFIFVYCSSIFIGAIINLRAIWECADLAIGSMTLINIVILFLMRKEVKDETDIYFNKIIPPRHKP